MNARTTSPDTSEARKSEPVEPVRDTQTTPRKLRIEALETRVAPGVVLTGAD